MFRPLWLDLLDLVFLPLTGVLLFVGGAQLHRLPRMVFRLVLALAVLVVGFLVTAYFSPLRDWTDEWFCIVGGERVVGCGAGLLLIGAVWSQPGRSTSSAFLVVLVAIVTVILLLDGSSRLAWRWGDSRAFDNGPDENGRVRQSSAVTCGPAAAVMLLNVHGIKTTEGELAYEAGTSLFGTSLSTLVRVLNTRAQPDGLTAQVERIPYETWMEREEPFIAHVRIPGGHALFVDRMTPIEVFVIDPASGDYEKMTRQVFERRWEGRAISLRPRP